MSVELLSRSGEECALPDAISWSPPIISLEEAGKKQIGHRSNVAVKVFEVHGLVTGALDCRCVKVGDGTMTVYVDMLGDQAHTITASDTNQSFVMTSLQHIAPTYGDSMFSTTRDTVIGECNEPVDATEGGITMDLTCESGHAGCCKSAPPVQIDSAGLEAVLRNA